MKIARSKDTVKLTLSKAEWELLGKHAGWSGISTDPALDIGGFGDGTGGIGSRGYGLHGGGSSTQATEEGDGLTDIDNGPVDNTVDDGLDIETGAPEGDTFLNADPNAKPVKPDPGAMVNSEIASDQGEGSAIGDGWDNQPQEPGDYVMTSDGAGGLEQQVYWDGKQLFFDNDPNPHHLSEVTGSKFKLRPVGDPQSEIPEGSGGIHGGHTPPLDIGNAPF